MTFWWATLSALLAAIAAGIILKKIFQQKRSGGIGVTKVDHSKLEDTEIVAKVKTKRAEATDLGNIDVSNSEFSGTKIKSNVTIDE